MASTWKNVFVEVPATGTTVWIVRLPYFDTPVQAVYSAADLAFIWTDSNAADNYVPQYLVFKWRDL
jgi:hypothetical protein